VEVEKELQNRVVLTLNQLWNECGTSVYLAAIMKWEGKPWLFVQGTGTKADEIIQAECASRSPLSIMEYYERDFVAGSGDAIAVSVRASLGVKPLSKTDTKRKDVRASLLSLITAGIPSMSSRSKILAQQLINSGANLEGFSRTNGMHWTAVQSYSPEECDCFLVAFNMGELKIRLPNNASDLFVV
jgi:hypothetical protein